MQTKSDHMPADQVDVAEAAAQACRLEQLSALLDHQASRAEVAEVSTAYAKQAELRHAWMAYQQVGEVLREGERAIPPASHAFVHAVMTRLQAEQAQQQPPVPPQAVPVVLKAPQRQEAANDALFRWKLVAGVATLAAVAAVVWQVTVPQQPAAGQWAQAPAPTVVAVGAPSQQAVLTPQGVLIRDPQLEALLAAHRQYGGQSALQMPTGFLRNATYSTTNEAPSR